MQCLGSSAKEDFPMKAHFALALVVAASAALPVSAQTFEHVVKDVLAAEADHHLHDVTNAVKHTHADGTTSWAPAVTGSPASVTYRYVMPHPVRNVLLVARSTAQADATATGVARVLSSRDGVTWTPVIECSHYWPTHCSVGMHGWLPAEPFGSHEVWIRAELETSAGVAADGAQFSRSPGVFGYVYRVRIDMHSGPVMSPQHGCVGNPVSLVPMTPVIAWGNVTSLRLTTSAPHASEGFAALLVGASGAVGGCGVFVPGLGEVLLDAGGPLTIVAQDVSSDGTADLSFLTPPMAGLLGITVHFQAAHVRVSDPGMPLELSNALAAIVAH
jgi:hypothetical protein